MLYDAREHFLPLSRARACCREGPLARCCPPLSLSRSSFSEHAARDFVGLCRAGAFASSSEAAAGLAPERPGRGGRRGLWKPDRGSGRAAILAKQLSLRDPYTRSITAALQVGRRTSCGRALAEERSGTASRSASSTVPDAGSFGRAYREAFARWRRSEKRMQLDASAARGRGAGERAAVAKDCPDCKPAQREPVLVTLGDRCRSGVEGGGVGSRATSAVAVEEEDARGELVRSSACGQAVGAIERSAKSTREGDRAECEGKGRAAGSERGKSARGGRTRIRRDRGRRGRAAARHLGSSTSTPVSSSCAGAQDAGEKRGAVDKPQHLASLRLAPRARSPPPQRGRSPAPRRRFKQRTTTSSKATRCVSSPLHPPLPALAGLRAR